MRRPPTPRLLSLSLSLWSIPSANNKRPPHERAEPARSRLTSSRLPCPTSRQEKSTVGCGAQLSAHVLRSPPQFTMAQGSSDQQTSATGAGGGGSSQATRSAGPGTASQTQTQAQSQTQSPILRLRGAQRNRGPRVQWAESVVDNEGMGKKSSKGKKQSPVTSSTFSSTPADYARQYAASTTRPRRWMSPATSLPTLPALHRPTTPTPTRARGPRAG